MKQFTVQWPAFHGHLEEDLKEPFAIRAKVFMEEQGFSYDMDDIDRTAYHALLLQDGVPAGTGRLFCQDGVWTVGRVAVLKEARGQGIGLRVMEAIEEKAKALGLAKIGLMAQEQAAAFYERAGYHSTNRRFVEEGVPHIWMEKVLL